MEIFPQDLGLSRHVALIRRRTLGDEKPTALAEDPPPPRMGALGRLWAQGSGLEPAAAAAALPAAKNKTLGILHGVGGTALFFLVSPVINLLGGDTGAFHVVMATTSATMLTLAATVFPGRAFRTLHRKPVTVGEIEALLPAARDGLERSYLTLLIDVIRQAAVPPEAAREIRSALRALGEALERLPAVSALPADADALRRESAALCVAAEAEPDPVVSASLERRAEALRRAAHAAEHSALVVRRAAVLREEMAAQTEALRLGLAAFYTGGTDVASLAHLADAVRSVATEAVSVAQARAELDAGGSIPDFAQGGAVPFPASSGGRYETRDDRDQQRQMIEGGTKNL